ncbi:MAG: alpha/beta hydrolase [Synergistaceae bacterium]|nr:alpha/beta hydrolase [Synergistaceae bacterium]
MDNENNKEVGAQKSYSALWFFLLFVFVFFGLRLLLPWLVFMPTATIEAMPRAFNMPFEDVFLTTSDDVRIHGWYVPAPNARGTLLFFHGNAGNISWRLDSIEIFHDLGLSVLIIDYRGYGRSGGRRSVPGVTLDALAAWNWLTEEKGVPADEIVVFGRSLGGAVAMDLMRYVKPRALILESTFSSLPEMVRLDFLAPLMRLLIGDVWNSAEVAATLTVPVLSIHSPDDRTVLFKLGKRLYDAVASEKTFVEIHGSHNEGFQDSWDIYVPALDAFLTKHLGKWKKNNGVRGQVPCGVWGGAPRFWL